MPFRSLAQQRYFEANKAKLESQGVNVSEWEKSTGDKPLPERIGKTHLQKSKEKLARGMKGKVR